MSADGLYLPPARSGVAWLLDPDHPHLAERVDAALASTADTPVDPDAFSDDLGVLALLLQERHFGIATGRVAAGPALAAIHAAAERCRRERPATFGDAWGTLVDDLRSLTGDRHVQATGAGPSVIRADDPAAAFPAGEPAVQVSSDDGVLWVRLARLAGSAKDLADLSRFVEEAPAHFRHDRIVVDLRGNTGGDDSFVLAWAAQGVPEAINYPETAREWRIGGFVPNAWNWAAIEESRHGPGGLPPELAKHRHTPGPADVLKVVDVAPAHVPVGPVPWRGRMLVLTDARTGSSGESGAWILKHLLGARLAGAPGKGCIEYGNIAPYVLPNTGAVVTLATKHNDYGFPVEMQGFPVDVELDVTLPAAELVAAWRWDASSVPPSLG